MSDAPRTDAIRLRHCAEGEKHIGLQYVQLVQFAEAMERELAEKNKSFSDGANAYEGSTLERLDILVHELTGDEGEDDSFTVLRRKWLDLAAERDEARGAAVKANRAVERLHGLLREMKAAMLGYPMPMRALTPTALLHAINAELREPEEAMK